MPNLLTREVKPLTKNQVIIYLLLTLLFLLAITSQPTISQVATPETLFVTVYSDGFVFIDYTVLLDPTSPTQNITVFGQVLEDLLVVNNDGLPIDYSLWTLY
jgi:hypothetical protein